MYTILSDKYFTFYVYKNKIIEHYISDCSLNDEKFKLYKTIGMIKDNNIINSNYFGIRLEIFIKK